MCVEWCSISNSQTPQVMMGGRRLAMASAIVLFVVDRWLSG
jgi:hypothetical protein